MTYATQWEALLDDIDDFLEDQEDIRDGENGEQLPNKAMSLLTSLRYLRPAVTEGVTELARELEGLKAAKGYVQDYRATGPNGEPVAAICATDGCAMQRTPSPEGIACSCIETYPQLIRGKVSHGPGCEQSKQLPPEANELAAMMRDARRYRWMRKQKDVDIAACWLLPPDVSLDTDDLNTPEQLDAAIDREIGASSPPQKDEQAK